MSYIIACDLDGTLAHYDEWKGVYNIGEPIPEMLAKVKAAIILGHEVIIFTARMSSKSNIENDISRSVIEKWCEKHIGIRLDCTATKHGYFDEFWDDRAVGIKKNEGTTRLGGKVWCSIDV